MVLDKPFDEDSLSLPLDEVVVNRSSPDKRSTVWSGTALFGAEILVVVVVVLIVSEAIVVSVFLDVIGGAPSSYSSYSSNLCRLLDRELAPCSSLYFEDPPKPPPSP